MSVPRFPLVLSLFLVFSSQFFVVATFAEASESEAVSALVNAEGAMVSGYQAVLKAEEAGANVSDVLVRLNEAGVFLAEARMAYRLGEFDKAVGFADLSRNIGVEVQNDAVGLRDSALSEGVQRMMLTMIASVVGIALVALGSFLTWHFLKKRYGQATVV